MINSAVVANILSYALSLGFVILVPGRLLLESLSKHNLSHLNGFAELLVFAMLAPAGIALTELIRNFHAGSLACIFEVTPGHSLLSRILSRISFGILGRNTHKVDNRKFYSQLGKKPAWLIFIASGSAFFGASAIFAFTQLQLQPHQIDPEFLESIDLKSRFSLLIYTTIFSPLAESTISPLLLLATQRCVGTSILKNSVAAAFIWAILHAIINSPQEGPPSFWLFFIFSGVYISSSRKWGVFRGIFMIATVHFANNFLTASPLTVSILRSLAP